MKSNQNLKTKKRKTNESGIVYKKMKKGIDMCN